MKKQIPFWSSDFDEKKADKELDKIYNRCDTKLKPIPLWTNKQLETYQKKIHGIKTK